MIWPFSRREVRSSYTELRIAQMVARAEGTTASDAIATIEAAVGLWERGFMAADSPAVTPEQLGMIGRSLLLRGQSVWTIEDRKLGSQASTIDIRGGEVLSYRLDIPAPSSTITRTLAASDVAHFRIGMDPARPWEGCSPLYRSDATIAMLKAVESKLSQEHGPNAPVGHLIGVPNLEQTIQRDQDGNITGSLSGDIANLDGKAALVETGTAGWVNGQPSRGAMSGARLGPNPAQYTVQTRLDSERSILAAAGVPIALVNPEAGTDTREEWRRFLHGTLTPIGRMVSAELRRVGLPDTLSFNRLMASDLAGRSRAYKQLIEAKMPESEARTICGF